MVDLQVIPDGSSLRPGNRWTSISACHTTISAHGSGWKVSFHPDGFWSISQAADLNKCRFVDLTKCHLSSISVRSRGNSY